MIGAISGKGTPLHAVQLLWVNLIMDTFAALALGTEQPTESLLKRRPFKLDALLISPLMWRNILCGAAWQLFITLIILFGKDLFLTGVPDNDDDINSTTPNRHLHYTIIFNTFTWMQLFNEFNSRKVNGEHNIFKGILSNTWFLSIWIITIIGQVIMVQWASDFAETNPLDYTQWLFSIGAAATIIPVSALWRLIPVDASGGMAYVPPDAFEGAKLASAEEERAATEEVSDTTTIINNACCTLSCRMLCDAIGCLLKYDDGDV